MNHPHVVDPLGKFRSNFLAIYLPASSPFDCCMFFGAIQRNRARLLRTKSCCSSEDFFFERIKNCFGLLNPGGFGLGVTRRA